MEKKILEEKIKARDADEFYDTSIDGLENVSKSEIHEYMLGYADDDHGKRCQKSNPFLNDLSFRPYL